MEKLELQKEVSKLKWFHQIELPTDERGTIITPGEVDHCTEYLATNRFGIPEDLSGKTVLDIGTHNGYFVFLAEKRGATGDITAIDPIQGDGDNYRCFKLAKEALNSRVIYYPVSLTEFEEKYPYDAPFDICFYFGVLYHVENPIEELKSLFNITGEYALIETAIVQTDYGNKNVWEFNNGFDGDKTNFWYPTLSGLTSALKYVGFSQVELIWSDGIRLTVKAIK